MRIFTLVQWTFGFLATSARTKDEIRLNVFRINFPTESSRKQKK